MGRINEACNKPNIYDQVPSVKVVVITGPGLALWWVRFPCPAVGLKYSVIECVHCLLKGKSRRGLIKEESYIYGYTGFLSEIGTKLRDLAVRQAGGSCYPRAALSSNDSKTRPVFMAIIQ